MFGIKDCVPLSSLKSAVCHPTCSGEIGVCGIIISLTFFLVSDPTYPNISMSTFGASVLVSNYSILVESFFGQLLYSRTIYFTECRGLVDVGAVCSP